MLEYLSQLPSEVIGQNMLGYLELADIIELEKSAASQKSQQFLKAIISYCPPIVFPKTWYKLSAKHEAINWCNNFRCRVQLLKIPVALLGEVDFEHSVLDNIELYLTWTLTQRNIIPLDDPNISRRITQLVIQGNPNSSVMEVLFPKLQHVRCLQIFDIQHTSIETQWFIHAKHLGVTLKELYISHMFNPIDMYNLIAEYCPYLEKLSLSRGSGGTVSNTLQTIVHNCPHLRYLDIHLNYSSSAEADADLTAFAEKCPQLEELSLYCRQLTDQSVIALAQHCSRLKKLRLQYCKLTAASLIALSERGLPLEELFPVSRSPVLRLLFSVPTPSPGFVS